MSGKWKELESERERVKTRKAKQLAKDPVSCAFLMMADGSFSFLWWFLPFWGNNITTFFFWNKTTKVPHIAFHVIFVGRSCSFLFTFLFIFCIFYNHVTMAIHFVHMLCPCSSLCICLNERKFTFHSRPPLIPSAIFVILSLFCCCCCCFCDREVRLHTYFSSMVKVLCKLWRLRYIIWFVAILCKMHMLQFSHGWMDDECMCAYWTI